MTNIDAINLLEEVKTLDDTMYAYNPCYEEALDMAISALLQPEIVRCVSCIYWDWEKRGSFETRGFCKLPGEVERERSWHDYCSRAERRQE